MPAMRPNVKFASAAGAEAVKLPGGHLKDRAEQQCVHAKGGDQRGDHEPGDGQPTDEAGQGADHEHHDDREPQRRS